MTVKLPLNHLCDGCRYNENRRTTVQGEVYGHSSTEVSNLELEKKASSGSRLRRNLMDMHVPCLLRVNGFRGRLCRVGGSGGCFTLA